MYYINSNIIEKHIEAEELHKHIGERVTMHGMIYKIREMSGFAFVLLKTKGKTIQCVYSPEYSEFSLSEIKENDFAELTGAVVSDERSKNGCELRILSVKVLSRSCCEPPIVINNRELAASLDTILDYRPVSLRNERETAIFKIQSEICKGIRRFMEENRFTEIHTPKLVSGSAEGGANVFRLDYFGKEAFLAQSPQFYKQITVGVFERVYEIAPVFRAEKHDTSRHINEYTSVDIEVGFIENYTELMSLETAMLKSVFKYIKESCEFELRLLKADVPEVSEIPVIAFREAKKLVSETFSRPITDESDFDPEEEKLLSKIIKEQTGSDFVFVTEYKSSKRPFYTMDCPENPSVTESFDLIFRGMEITTGGQRIHSYEQQLAKMKERGINPDDFESYLMAHKYGLPPHGGMGIGLERLTAKLLGFENVRRATLFPRDVKRIKP
ncbi:MAG: aspartate--tRNA(Asn) ligase [Acutalibacteraceae bacterium]